MVARSDDIPGVVSSSGILPFGGAAPTTLEEIKRRRAIAAALATRQRPFPTTIGQGLTSLGEAFGDVMADRRLSAQEAELEKRSAGAFAGSPVGAGAAVPPPTAAPVTPPVAAAPVGRPPPMLTPAAPSAADPRDLIARAIAEREGITGPTPPQPAREVASSGPTEAGASALPPVSPTVSASAPLSPTAGGDDDPIWAARMGAIGGIESRGAKDPYRAIGAPTKYGRGIGRYQVVEANIAPWTQAALGQALTPQQYLASPQAQDAVFKHRFGQYIGQFGEEGAARAWFGGPGNVNKTELSDVHKRLSIGDYGKSYMEGLQAGADPTRIAAYAPTGTATDAPPIGARGGVAIPPLAEENPVTPSDIMPAPTRVAEARGVVPGAAPVQPPSPGAAPGEYRPPKPTPPEPLKRIPETDLERRIRETLIINPEYRPALLAAQQAAAERKMAEDSEKTRYQADVQRYEAERKEEQAWLAGAGEREDKKRMRDLQVQEHQQKVKQAQEAEQLRQTYGNLPAPIASHLEESKKGAAVASASLEGMANARQAMEAGTIFGFGAEAKLIAYQVAAAAGNKYAARIVAATETFKTNLGPAAQAAIRAYGGAQISNEDRRFGLQMSGADISQNEESARRLLDIAERSARAKLVEHRDTTETFLKGQPEILRKLYHVPDPLPGVAVRGGAPTEASSARAYKDGDTATGPGGAKLIRRGGRWEPM